MPVPDGGREATTVWAEGDRRVLSIRAVHDPDRGGTAEERGQQVAPGLRRVIDRDRLAGEEERAAEVVLDERLRAEALGELGRFRGLRACAADASRLVGCVARLAALDDGEDAAGDGGGEEDGDADEEAAEAAVGAADAFGLLF